MYLYTQGHCRLVSTGAYIPEQRVTSRELMDSIDSKTVSVFPRLAGAHHGRARTARRPRAHAAPSDMAAQAAR